ncbi:MAG: CpsD/CapB family tyrosine-protein kinase [Lachnospiraceae bacterium]|nr:CpsD/CapB family tyrosine-protein kinase [Lachnospiraceae bacterium]
MAKKKGNISTGFQKRSASRILTSSAPFVVKEAYNSLRTKLLFVANGEECPVFTVTSAQPGEGKTTTALNLAISFAQAGKKTLLVDGDLRNASLHKYFRVERSPGLSELLAGMDNEVRFPTVGVENLTVLTAGENPPNPAELLMSIRMDALLAMSKERFDCVFIDTPPVCVVTDAAVLASKVTGSLLVVRMGVTDRSSVRAAIDHINLVQGKVIGFILNDTDGKNDSYYKKGGYYKYEYGNPGSSAKA